MHKIYIKNFYAIINQKCFIFIEEPETHLHPDAQYLLAKYLAAFRNKTGSGLFITTHSPYILSSFNNLFYADKCADISKNTDSTNNIIPKQCWLKTDDFFAYIIENEVIKNIKDNELAMVDIAELDYVASKQDSEYEELLHVIHGGVMN